MKKALDGVKLSLKNMEKEERDVAKVGAPPADVLARLIGNSAEKILELEKEYEFTDVPLRECEQAKKWFQAMRPSTSCLYGPTVMSAYNLWLKWNLTRTGGKSRIYRGDLDRTREEEAVVAM